MNGLLLIVAALLIAINGLFVAAEFALVRSKASHLSDAKESENESSRRALEAVEHIDENLAACQLGITMASIGLGFVGEPVIGGLLRPALEPIFGDSAGVAIAIALAFAIVTVAHVVVGELAPKTVAIAKPEGVARWVSSPLRAFRILFSPLIRALNSMANGLVRMFGVKPITQSEGTTGEDLRLMIAHARTRKTLDPGEAHMLTGVFELHEHEARQVMTPIPAVVTVDVSDDVESALRICMSSGHTRLPVTEDPNTDHIVGVVHLSSLARLQLAKRVGVGIEQVVRPAHVVPETKPLDDLLADLQRERVSMAVVVDEYGRTAGIVTVEDIVEEVVGEIHDETDPAFTSVRRLANGSLYVRGHVPLADLEDHGIDLPVDSDAYNSIGGFVFGVLGRLPKRGDQVRSNGYVVRVESVRENRIEAVSISEKSADPETGEYAALEGPEEVAE